MNEQMLQAHLTALGEQRAEADRLRGARQHLFEELVLRATRATIGSAGWLGWAKGWVKRVQDTDGRIKATGQ